MAGGTGIGLYSLSKRIEALNGSYGVGGRKDGHPGSVFWFAVPYRQDCVDNSCAEVDPKESLNSEAQIDMLTGARILVVDDSMSILNLISRVLKTKGALVTTCENGALGLQAMKDAVRERSFDMVLTDLQVDTPFYLFYLALRNATNVDRTVSYFRMRAKCQKDARARWFRAYKEVRKLNVESKF